MKSNQIDKRVTGVSRYPTPDGRVRVRLLHRRSAVQTLRDWVNLEGFGGRSPLERLVPPIQRALLYSRKAAFKRWIAARWAHLYARSPTLQVWGPLFTSKFWIDWE